MGAVLGICSLGEAACCFGSAACSCCCRCCPSTTHSTMTRMVYAVVLLMFSIGAWIMLTPSISHEYRDHHFTDVGHIRNCEDKTDEHCEHSWGQLGALRVLFAPTVFFAFMGFVMLGVKSSEDMRAGFQNGMWAIKAMILAGTSIGSFFIDNNFFVAWTYMALVASVVFIVIQLILIVDFAHSWNESWFSKAEDGNKCYTFGLLMSTFLMYALSFTILVLLYVYFAHGHCPLNKFFITMTLISAVVCTAVSLHPRVREANPSSGILQSGVVTLYISYLTYSAVASCSDEGCKPADLSKSNTITTVIGALFTFVAVIYSALRTSSASQMGRLGLTKEGADSTVLIDEEKGGDDDDDGSGHRVIDNERSAVAYSWSHFHFVFMLAAFYVSMVLTDWPLIKDHHDAGVHVGEGMASVWVQMVSAWLCVLLYLWSLVAPICLPDREFS